jgi:hypothetical protein
MRGHFAKASVAPKRKIAEFRVTPDNLIDVGAEITADHYVAGQFVDIAGTSIGKGFAGAMKRHNFGGLRASHGVSVSHRSHGSTGQCQAPARCSRARRWPVIWAPCASPPRTCKSSAPMLPWPDHGQGCGARFQGRLGHHQGCGEESRARWPADACRDPHGGCPAAKRPPKGVKHETRCDQA